jgi:hypothetical protein
MHWIKRGNGRYLYKTRKIKGHVISEYMGSGEQAELIDRLDQIENERIKAQRKAEQAAMHELTQTDQADAVVFDRVSRLVTAILLDAGCYKHRGQWRRYVREK